MESIYNCHTHIFTDKDVPNILMPLWHRRLLVFLRKIGECLNKHRTRNNYNIFDKVITFTNIGHSSSQLDVYNFLKGSYPEGTRFIVLSMDMEFMEAGSVSESYPEQLRQLSDIKKAFKDQIYPFIFADPRRENITDLVKEYIEEHDFKGIKMNPAFGYYPFDKRLHQVFKYAEANKVPVMSHCARGWAYYKGTISNDMLVHPETGTKLKKKWNKNFSNYFIHPGNYEFLLRDFPDLKLCLAHLGGKDEFRRYSTNSRNGKMGKNWTRIIIDYIKKYPNVYTDISYTMHDVSLFPTLKAILEDREISPRVLYGSDFYMVQQEASEQDFNANVRHYLGEDNYRQIAMINPKNFLEIDGNSFR